MYILTSLGCLLEDLSVQQVLVGRYRPAHLGNLIRRLSTEKHRCDSSQYCSDVIIHPDWYRPLHGHLSMSITSERYNDRYDYCR